GASLEADREDAVVRVVRVRLRARDGARLDDLGRVADRVERGGEVGQDAPSLCVLDLGEAAGVVVAPRLDIAVPGRERRAGEVAGGVVQIARGGAAGGDGAQPVVLVVAVGDLRAVRVGAGKGVSVPVVVI